MKAILQLIRGEIREEPPYYSPLRCYKAKDAKFNDWALHISQQLKLKK